MICFTPIPFRDKRRNKQHVSYATLEMLKSNQPKTKKQKLKGIENFLKEPYFKNYIVQ